MKKVISMLAMLLLTVGIVSATTATDVLWNGNGNLDVKVSNDYSEAYLQGTATTNYMGEFHADDDNYDRIEVTGATGTFTNGGYNFNQWNDLQTGESDVGFYTTGDSGFMNFKTDEWKQGNALKTNGYNGYSWSWPGTDEPAMGASGEYSMGMFAGTDSDSDGTYDSSYDVTVNGNGNYGLGTWSAGSTSILNGGRTSVSGNVLGHGSGTGTITEHFENTGSFTTSFSW